MLHHYATNVSTRNYTTIHIIDYYFVLLRKLMLPTVCIINSVPKRHYLHCTVAHQNIKIDKTVSTHFV